MSRWFRNEALRNLDEEGIPIQISERFLRSGDDRNSLAQRLSQIAIQGHPSLAPFERAWLLDALDVDVDGNAPAPNVIG